MGFSLHNVEGRLRPGSFPGRQQHARTSKKNHQVPLSSPPLALSPVSTKGKRGRKVSLSWSSPASLASPPRNNDIFPVGVWEGGVSPGTVSKQFQLRGFLMCFGGRVTSVPQRGHFPEHHHCPGTLASDNHIPNVRDRVSMDSSCHLPHKSYIL